MMPRQTIIAEVHRLVQVEPKSLGEALKLASQLQSASGFRNVSVAALMNRLKDLKRFTIRFHTKQEKEKKMAVCEES